MRNALLHRLLSFARRDRFERELSDELQFHVDMETESIAAQGVPRADARRQALLRFGGVDKFKEACRDQGRPRRLEGLLQDFRFGCRTLCRQPSYTLVALLTLGLGIGANTAVFSVVHSVLLKPLPFDGGDRLVHVAHVARRAERLDTGFSALEVEDLRRQTRTLEGIVEYHSMPFNLYGRGEPQRVATGVVSAGFFDLLGVKPLIGRTFRAGEDAIGAAPVLVLSYAFWQRALGGDPSIVGTTLEMNDRVHTVIGVLPPIPQYPDENDVYMPWSSCPFRSRDTVRTTRNLRAYTVLAKVTPGASAADVRAELGAIEDQWRAEHPEDYPAQLDLAPTTTPVLEELTRDARSTFLLLLGTAGFVLLIACANIANLSLARLLRRERELALRAALGAGWGRLLQQMMVESTTLGIAGGLLGLGLAASTLHLLRTFAAKFTPRAGEIALDGWVLLFTVAVSVGTGVLVGALGATSRGDLVPTLKSSGDRSTASAGRMRLRKALVVGQVAVSFMLLTGAGLMVRSLVKLQQVDDGFNPDNVLTARIDLNWSKYNEQGKTAVFAESFLERLEGTPGVVSAGVANTFPLNAGSPITRGFLVEGRAVAPDAPLPRADLRSVSRGYFQSVGMYLVRGRLFTREDKRGPEVVVINRAMANRYWPGRDPLGQRLSLDQGTSWLTIVGIVGDVRQYGPQTAPVVELYVPFENLPWRDMRVIVRTRSEPMRMAADIRRIVRELDPAQPVTEVETLRTLRSESLASPRLTAWLLGLFAMVALLITAAGLLGLVAFSVSQRSLEIGIRLALGADRSEVVRMVVAQGLGLVAVGLALGGAAAAALSHLMQRLLYEIAPTDPLTFAAVAVMLLVVAAVAALVPARRAAAISPVLALRST